MSTYKSTKSDKSQGGLLAENYVSAASKSFTRHLSFGSERKYHQHLSNSFKLNRNSTNESLVDQDNDREHLNDIDDNNPLHPHDVLSDSEYNHIHRLDNVYPQRPNTNYDSDRNESQNPSPLHHNDNKKEDEANRSMPLNISDESTKKMAELSRSKSVSFRKNSAKKLFKYSKYSRYSDNTASPLLSPPRYYSKYDRKRSQKKQKRNKKNNNDDEYKYDEISRMRLNDGVLESDYTSMYSSDDDASSLYKFQLKRWRQMKNMWCCCKCHCCLDGSYLCQCIAFIQRIWRVIVYYKWLVVSLLFMLLMIFINLYSFSHYQVKENINEYINKYILFNINNWTFNMSLFCQIISVIGVIVVLINIYLAVSLYKMMNMNVLLLCKEVKYSKQMNRLKDRREVLKSYNIHINEEYHFGEKIWNRLLLIHEHFALWLRMVHDNLCKIRKEQDNDAISSLYKIHDAMSKYNAEIECLIFVKLKHDIEDNIKCIMLQHQFNTFVQKVPKKYRKKFNELKNGDKAVSNDKIYLLLTKVLESYRTTDNVLKNDTEISNLYGGYLQYGHDEDILMEHNHQE